METSNPAKINIIRSHELQADFDTTEIERDLQFHDRSSESRLAEFAIKHSSRRMLPYGIWTCQDGREVVFNREYQPIFQKIDGVNSFADRGEWVKDIVQTVYLFNDANSPIDLLVNKYAGFELTSQEKKESKRSLHICLSVIKKYQPKEGQCVNRAYSV